MAESGAIVVEVVELSMWEGQEESRGVTLGIEREGCSHREEKGLSAYSYFSTSR